MGLLAPLVLEADGGLVLAEAPDRRWDDPASSWSSRDARSW